MRKERGNGMKKMKLTKLEKFWVLYDVGNSAFIMLVSTIIPIYFNYLAGKEGISEVDYLAYWDMRLLLLQFWWHLLVRF